MDSVAYPREFTKTNHQVVHYFWKFNYSVTVNVNNQNSVCMCVMSTFFDFVSNIVMNIVLNLTNVQMKKLFKSVLD